MNNMRYMYVQYVSNNESTYVRLFGMQKNIQKRVH